MFFIISIFIFFSLETSGGPIRTLVCAESGPQAHFVSPHLKR